MSVNASFTKIIQRLSSMRSMFPFLRTKPDDYVFSALCIKYSIYKNPSLDLSESDLIDAIIDGPNDGGADFILIDPNNNEASDLIIAQSKCKESISIEEAKNAVNKMIDFYFKMRAENFERVRFDVVNRYQRLNAEIGEESKFIFALYVSAQQKTIKKSTLNKIVSERLGNEDRYELRIYFGSEIEEEIDEAESRQPYVEKGELDLDESNNMLKYGDDAAIVNISAKSLKSLYSINGNNLLSMNLRYFTKKQDIDSDIKSTIVNAPESFWFKNNGITIICDDYEIDAKKLKLRNFSIINGGQTTYLVFKSNFNNYEDDFYISCKVITAKGNTQDEKDEFILEIAKATNSQKAIKDTDLKANSLEQLQFSRAMKECGIYYKTKRGDKVPKDYKVDYLHSDYPSTGKLYLAGIYQLPAKSRNKPSTMKDIKYYNPVFLSSTRNSSGLIRDFLYVNYYFKHEFIKDYDKVNEGAPEVPFANNSRTMCVAFVGLASRLMQGNINAREFRNLINSNVSDSYYEDRLYPYLKKFEEMTYIIKPSMFKEDRLFVDEKLNILFKRLINEGYKRFSFSKELEPSLTESNYLKKDTSYYQILSGSWNDLYDTINECQEIFK